MSHGDERENRPPPPTTGTSKPRALIVEDHPGFAEIIRIHLERSGWIDVLGIASSPDEALDLVANEHPEVVLIDVGLPSGNEGVAVAGAIKRVSRSTTVVMLTG
jgi:DNA-binding NarL/FixJ family response regulator